MPTPVSAARQCLTPDAARALDDAVSVARRRAHSQTTSLHALHALLALPSSALRSAVAVARNAAYSPRHQLRALDLCSAAALDRLPSVAASAGHSPPPDEPPVSNSFMAAIKRSQANQRRHPDSFHYYQQQQQQQQQQGSISCVKVELQQLIFSILDDPVVSRVFGEAGFRSCDVKLAIVRPPGSMLRLQRSRRPPPPMFLCHLTGDRDGDVSSPGPRSFSFPFAGGLSDGDEDCRRVGKVLAREKERNPLLVGGAASESVRRMVERGGEGVLPAEIAGLSFVSVESEVLKFVSTESGSEVVLRERFEELNQLIESCKGPGVVVSFGDLKVLVEEGLVGPIRFVVAQLTKLLELHRPKVWLMGATASYEMYSKFLMRFPSIQKDWDLQLVPITSLRPHSLMESFVPFGGFFPLPSDLKEPFSSSTYQSKSRCSTCNEKCEQEISFVLNGGCTLSVADQYQESLPPWMQMTEVNANNRLNVAKAKDDGTALNAKVAGVQRKWSDRCRRLNHSSPVSDAGSHQVRAQMFPGITGFPFATARKDKADNPGSSSSINATLKGSVCENVFPNMLMGLQKFPLMDQKIPRPAVSEAKSDNIASELQGRPSHCEGLQRQGYQFPECSISNSSNPSHHVSPSSAASVATDLGLGTIYASSSAEELNEPTFQAHKERLKDISGCFPSNVDVVNSNINTPSVRSSSCSAPDLSVQADPKDFKALYRSLVEKVGRQDEAIHAISQTIACCRTDNERHRGAGASMRRNIWFSFIGPDRVAKTRIAVALAEIFFGSRHNLICVDLSSHHGSAHTNTIFDSHEISGYDVKFRGKTAVDYIAEEITKKPLSVVFLENIDKADQLAQSSLSQAIKTGKFQDTHGREVRINNSIFVTTARFLKDKERLSFGKDLAKFSEERILEAQRLEMQILIDCIPGVKTMGNNITNVMVTSRKDSFDPALVNKRKRTGSDGHGELFESGKRAPKTSKCLDLNLPIEEMEADYSDSGSSESETISENSQLWLEDFLDQMNRTVFFKPFDFDALANMILKEISAILTKTVGSEVLLEIDSKVMEQILAAAWLSDGKREIEDWVDRVLGRSLMEASKRYSLNTRSLLKLLNCEGLHMEEQSPGVCLPARVILN